MEKMRSTLIVLCIALATLWTVGSVAVAMDQCDVIGNSYTLVLGGNDWTLSNFDEAPPLFSPAPQCAGTVILLGPVGQYSTLDWIGVFAMGGLGYLDFMLFFLKKD